LTESKYPGCTKVAAEIVKIGLALAVGLVILCWPARRNSARR